MNRLEVNILNCQRIWWHTCSFSNRTIQAKNNKRAAKPIHQYRQEMTTKQTKEKKCEGITAYLRYPPHLDLKF
jgi:hypothetical protein